MSTFSEQFLRDDSGAVGWLRRLRRKPVETPQVFLSAFGKHPGWNDHLDDLGLQTESLALAKQLLYVEGIGGQLNAGAWDNLPEEKQLPVFWHAFLWRREHRVLAGRLWSSTDGKGRGRYPMVICAEIDGAPLEWTFQSVMPRLEGIEVACRSTDSAEEVRAIIDTERQALMQEAAGLTAEVAGHEASTPSAPLDWSEAGDEEAVLRVLYHLHSRLGEYALGREGSGRARELRLSRRADATAVETLRWWSAAFDALLDPGAPVLFFLPLDGPWLDVVVGQPVSESFFALRATPAALPPADQVPYTLDSAWRQQAGAFLAGVPADERGKLHAAKEFWRAPAG